MIAIVYNIFMEKLIEKEDTSLEDKKSKEREPELDELIRKKNQLEEDIAYTNLHGDGNRAHKLEIERLELLDIIERKKGLYDDPMKEVLKDSQ